MQSLGAVSENPLWHTFVLLVLRRGSDRFKTTKSILCSQIIIAGLWDSFLEMRIRLQKAIVVANKLPQKDQMAEFSSLRDKNMKEVYKQGT